MGQGAHTRVAQVIAENLEIPFENVFIMRTTTDQLANMIEDGGSWGSLTSMRLAVKDRVKFLNNIKFQVQQ